VIWPSLVFQADCDEIELQKISYGIILVTSSPLRQRNDVTKITSFFSNKVLLISARKSRGALQIQGGAL